MNLTYHKNSRQLHCHYCGYVTPQPAHCPNCKNVLTEQGFGTERLEEEIATIFPNARFERMDLDTTRRKNGHKNIINRLIVLDGISIEIIGSWVWVTGNTYRHKELIKSLMFRWSSSKKAWYFHGNDYHKTSKKTFTLDEIRDLYGSQTVTSKPPLKLTVV